LRFLEDRTGVPVLGVLPHVRDLRIADEDSVALDERRTRRPAADDEIEIAVIRLPRIANYDDVQPLEHEPGVVVRFVERAENLSRADLVILPGTKTTIADLGWLRESGVAASIARRAERGRRILGICGGCQMLGTAIDDPERIESPTESAEGLGLLPIRVRFERSKRTAQVRARAHVSHWLAGAGEDVFGYEIHMGKVERLSGAEDAFEIHARNGESLRAGDGAISGDGKIVGTMIHGLFENANVRRALLGTLRRERTLPEPAVTPRIDEYDRLADVLRANVRTDLLHRLVGL